MPPFSAIAWPEGVENDCSGYISWCLRFSENRKVDHPLYKKENGGWFETSGIHADGEHATGYFTKITKPVPGELLVYPDYKDSTGKRRDGHIGLVLEANGSGIAGATKVIQCSLGNFRSKKDAVLVTGPEVWLKRPNSIIVWLDNWGM